MVQIVSNCDISLQISILIILFLLLYLCCFSSYPPSFPFPSILLVILDLILSSSSSQPGLFALPPVLASVAAAAVSLEAPQKVGPEAAEGAEVASGPVGRGHVLLQPAGQKEGELAVLTAVRTLYVVAPFHVGDGETCKDMHRDR